MYTVLSDLLQHNRPAAVAYSGPAGQPESPLAKFLIGGGVSVAFELCAGHTLEFVKVNKQTTFESYFNIVKKITAQKGVVGLLDGFFPWGVLQALGKGAVFSWGQALSISMLHDVSWMSKEQKTVISGGMGGLVQGVVLSPLLLLKTRVMTDPAFRNMSGGALGTAAASAQVGARVIRTEGVMALMKGAGVFSLKRAADWTTRYMFVVLVEEAMKKDKQYKLSETEAGIASCLGGALSAVATIPLDVMVSTVQQANKAGSKVSVVQTFKDQIAAGTMMKFATAGLAARVVHVALVTFMMKNMTSIVYDMVYGKQQPQQ